MTDPERAATRVGLVGLGNMGRPMAIRMHEGGKVVRAFDLDTTAREAVAALGIETVDTVLDAVTGAEVVVLMLPSTAVVRTVLEDESVLDALAEGALVVDMGSSEPVATQEIAAVLRRRGVRMIDAPVSGGVTGAEAGTLTIMVGGAETDYEDAMPLLRTMGHPVHVGAVGAGDATKALNNLLSATHLWVTSEAVLAGERFGIDPEVLLSVVNASSGRSGSSEVKWPRYVLPGAFDSGFDLALMLKDMRIAVDLCDRVGLPSRLGADAVGLWEQAAGGLPDGADHTEVARWIRAEAAGT